MRCVSSSAAPATIAASAGRKPAKKALTIASETAQDLTTIGKLGCAGCGSANRRAVGHNADRWGRKPILLARQQKDREERPDSALYIGQKEIQPVERPLCTHGQLRADRLPAAKPYQRTNMRRSCSAGRTALSSWQKPGAYAGFILSCNVGEGSPWQRARSPEETFIAVARHHASGQAPLLLRR
jgi:hypothetical protein